MERYRRILQDRMDVDLAHAEARQKRLEERLQAYTRLQGDLGALLALESGAKEAVVLPLRDAPSQRVRAQRVLELRVCVGLDVFVAMDPAEALRLAHEMAYNLGRKAALWAERAENVRAYRRQFLEILSADAE